MEQVVGQVVGGQLCPSFASLPEATAPPLPSFHLLPFTVALASALLQLCSTSL